jgi:hypothetical protein
MKRSRFLPRLLALFLLTTASVGAAPTAPSEQRRDAPRLSDNARKHFNAGLAYVDDPTGSKWEEAYREFVAAYADTPSWILKNNIALCALMLERDAEAVEAYKEYLAGGGEPDLSPKARKQIETDIATLSASLVHLELETAPADVGIIDTRTNSKGSLVINTYTVTGGKVSIGLHPGRHKLVAEAPGYAAQEWIVDAAPGSSITHRFALTLPGQSQLPPTTKAAPPTLTSEQPKPAERKIHPGVYVAGIATGAFAAAATVTGFVTLSKQKDYENVPDDAEASRIAKTGKVFRTLTDIEIGAAVLSAGATAYFYFAGLKATRAEVTSVSSVHVTPTFGPSTAGLSVQGRF